MGLPIHLEQLRRIHVRIALRGRQLHVTQQLLDRAQIGAALEQMAGERVTQRVRADPEARAAPRDVARHETLHAAAGQPRAPRIHE